MKLLFGVREFVAFLIILIVLIYGVGYIVDKTYFKLNENQRIENLELRIAKSETLISESDKLDKVLGISEDDTGELIREYKRDNESLKINTIKRSPSGKNTAYFQHKFAKDLKEMDDEDYAYIVVDQGIKAEPVFKSDFRLTDFEWLFDDELAVYRDCGTECVIAYVVNIDTKKYEQLPLGVGYTWSPDKYYVAAYRYSGRYGVSIGSRGNKYGRSLYEIIREPPPTGSALIVKTELKWSPDSSKFALVIRKNDEERLEMLVFGLRNNNFTLLSQRDLGQNASDKFFWKGASTVIYYESGEEKMVKLQ